MEQNGTRRPPRLLKGPMEGPGIRTYIIASLSVFIACSTIAIWAWHSARQGDKRNLQEGLSYSTTLVQEAVQNRLRTYEELTRGAGALIYTHDGDMNQDTWDRYVASLDLNQNYPGVRSVGYAPHVSQSQLGDFTANLPNLGVTNFALDPPGERPSYTPVTFLATNTPRSVVRGTDLSSEPVRRTALEEARDSDKLVLSGRVIPLMYKNDQKQAGFYIFYPIYQQGLPTSTLEERRAALQGYSFSFLRSSDLFDGLFKALPVPTSGYALQFFDGSGTQPENLLYQSPTYEALQKADGTTRIAQTLKIENRQWTITVSLSKALQNNDRRIQPLSILVYGLIFSTLVSGSLLIIMVSRARSLAYEKQQEVQAAKDELLSLASHQLRTPATGVKQFVGMLLEGYAGKLTRDQRNMLEKAYHSNDRQLELINDILYVTRLDAGRMVLNRQRLELNALVRSLIDEQRSTLAERKQTISFRTSAKKVYITADEQYLSMALDNLINNAGKYSRHGQRISVRVIQHRDSVEIYVKDRGVGIHEDDLHKLFKKFSRIHNELSVEAGGSGIGLYLCHEIIKLHGGTIDIQTMPNRGSTFIVTLPKNVPVES